MLRLSTRTIGDALEAEAIAAIRAAAVTLSSTIGATGSSCALQAKFLEKITTQLTTVQNSGTRSGVASGVGHRPSVVNPSDLSPPEISAAPEGTIEFPFWDTGDWDNVFASVGLNIDTDISIG